GSMRIEASLADYRRLLAWAKRWPQRKWAVENASTCLPRRPAGCVNFPAVDGPRREAVLIELSDVQRITRAFKDQKGGH
ncbi:hypothetical protein ACFU9X_44925, partial [Streptomyces atratus]|uniref:hypothetical protein n=1 Tax=Streptomyces atratus TaxID=1893 RepID=UPI0036B5BC0C